MYLNICSFPFNIGIMSEQFHSSSFHIILKFSAKILVLYVMIKEIGAGLIKTLKCTCNTLDTLEYFWHKIFLKVCIVLFIIYILHSLNIHIINESQLCGFHPEVWSWCYNQNLVSRQVLCGILEMVFCSLLETLQAIILTFLRKHSLKLFCKWFLGLLLLALELIIKCLLTKEGIKADFFLQWLL